jgi:hypothetical protein
MTGETDWPWGMKAGRGERKIVFGCPVQKITGYPFPGVVVAAFLTTKGEPRVVVECTAPAVLGCMHIFNPEQLEVLSDE